MADGKLCFLCSDSVPFLNDSHAAIKVEDLLTCSGLAHWDIYALLMRFIPGICPPASLHVSQCWCIGV